MTLMSRKVKLLLFYIFLSLLLDIYVILVCSVGPEYNTFKQLQMKILI